MTPPGFLQSTLSSNPAHPMRVINSPDIWQPRGRGFSMACAQPGDGEVIRFTGQVSWDADENIVGKGDVREQTRQCFRNIKALLASVGGQMQDLVEITTYFTDRSQLADIQQVRLEFLSPETPPVSTSVMVAGLGHPDFLVELTPIAVIPTERFQP